MLFRSAPGADAEEKEQEEEYAAKATEARTGLKAVAASFLVLFAAEWGDLSQLLTISMIAKYGHPVSVFIGAWAALLTVSGLAVLVGRVLLRHVQPVGDPLRRRGGLPGARRRHGLWSCCADALPASSGVRALGCPP